MCLVGGDRWRHRWDLIAYNFDVVPQLLLEQFRSITDRDYLPSVMQLCNDLGNVDIMNSEHHPLYGFCYVLDIGSCSRRFFFRCTKI
jgi:hypothetical protein